MGLEALAASYAALHIPAPAIERLLRAWMPGGARWSAHGNLDDASEVARVDQPIPAELRRLEPVSADQLANAARCYAQLGGGLGNGDRLHARSLCAGAASSSVRTFPLQTANACDMT